MDSFDRAWVLASGLMARAPDITLGEALAMAGGLVAKMDRAVQEDGRFTLIGTDRLDCFVHPSGRGGLSMTLNYIGPPEDEEDGPPAGTVIHLDDYRKK